MVHWNEEMSQQGYGKRQDRPSFLQRSTNTCKNSSFYGRVHFKRPPVYVIHSDSIHSQSSMKSGHYRMPSHFPVNFYLITNSDWSDWLQMYTDKLFQKYVLTCMKVTASVLSLVVEYPVLESRLFQVCSTQWLISDLPSWWLGINSLRIIRSRFRDARNT